MDKRILIIGALLLAGFGAWKMRTPRGIRNNNPGNIRGSDAFKWQGEVGRDYSDFVIFDTPENGIRALSRLLVNYQDRHGLNTVADIIGRYAPSSENNTRAYVENVASKIGVYPNEPFNVRERMTPLVMAIIQHENGLQPYDPTTIETGIQRGIA